MNQASFPIVGLPFVTKHQLPFLDTRFSYVVRVLAVDCVYTFLFSTVAFAVSKALAGYPARRLRHSEAQSFTNSGIKLVKYLRRLLK